MSFEHPAELYFHGVSCLIGTDDTLWRYKITAEAQERWSAGYDTYDAAATAASAAAAMYRASNNLPTTPCTGCGAPMPGDHTPDCPPHWAWRH